MLELGYKVNYLTIISNEIKKEGKNKFYLCSCKCGNEKYILYESLRKKRIRDCGCGKYMIEKHIGEQYGLLTIKKCYRKRINGRINIIAYCKCQCGNSKDFIMSELKGKNIKSCGCLNLFNHKNYINKKYNKITIIDFVNINNKIVKCKCECGNIFETHLYKITSDKRYKNGCPICSSKKYCKEHNILYIKKTSLGISRIKRIYNKMIDRCYNEKAKDFKWYGDKNIKVCDEWLKSKQEFINWSIKNGYQDDLTIDRIDTRGNYEPSNCRWVNMEKQQNNRANNVRFFVNGKNLSIKEISKIYGINPNTLRSRLYIAKMSIEEAITIPVKKRR